MQDAVACRSARTGRGRDGDDGPGDPPVTAGPGDADVHAVPIGSLLPADSPRLAGEDREHILRLAEIETPLPPILVHRSTMRVIDGMHRLRAAMLRGEKHIEVVFFDGSESEAFMRAVEMNVAHGLPLSHADRRTAAIRIMVAEPRLSDRVVAARTGLSARTVAAIRNSTAQVPRSNRRVGADGRTRPLSGAEGRSLAAEVIAARPDAPLREIAKTAGISLSTAHDVRRRLLMGQDPVPRRYAPQAPPAPAAAASAEGVHDTGDMRYPGGVRDTGGTPAATGDDGRDRRAADKDRPEILRKLMKDPSLRHTDPGRELLRMLNTRVVTADDLAAVLAAVPAHHANAVADVARQCARSWHQFAKALEQR